MVERVRSPTGTLGGTGQCPVTRGALRTSPRRSATAAAVWTLVRDECGVAPKEYQRIARFERSRSVLVHNAARGRADLAGVAAVAGYADQSHLTREWTAMAGCTPTTWLREEFPFLQDGGGADERGWEPRREELP